MHRRRFLGLAGCLGLGAGVGAPLLEPESHPAFAAELQKTGPSRDASPQLAVTLDRGWSIATDPDNVGRQQGWFRAPRSEAVATRVPSILQERFPEYHGVVWYWTRFEPDANPYAGGRYLLRFHAVDYLAEVWLNSRYLGKHEGGETPFVLDATDAVRAGQSNLLAVRVLNPGAKTIDGIVLNQTAHRNKSTTYGSGSAFDYGGIIEPVDLLLTPAVRITDIYLRPAWQTGHVQIRTTIRNTLPRTTAGQLHFSVTRTTISDPLLKKVFTVEAPSGETAFEHEVVIGDYRLWEIDDPCLYRLSASLQIAHGDGSHDLAVNFGFRDFRVTNGFFRLNGKRIFPRSTHTGNNTPVGQVIPPPGFPDMLRRDLLYAKASGFNMVRFICGVAHPYQLDLCDELGLMVYEESSASWQFENSSQMKERYDYAVTEMIARDRNHPSVVIWGMLNETKDGPVFREAVSALPLVRSVDPTRLVLLSSGRWDEDLETGSVSNPESAEWEYAWGKEGPGAGRAPKADHFPGPGTGDVHYYPRAPETPGDIRFIRALGQGEKPVFLSECGMGSMMDVIHEARMYEQAGIKKDTPDYILLRAMADAFQKDWARFGMDVVYPFPESLLRASQRLMAQRRLLEFNVIRANPRICGFNLTGMLDHGLTGEGVWRWWRDWKPGAFDAMQDGWAPVRWCLFVEPAHTYLGRPVNLEAVLANEDVVRPGEYPAQFRLWGPNGLAWQREASISIPSPTPGQDGPLAVGVLKEDVILEKPPGAYRFVPYIPEGIAPPETSWKFYLSDPQSLPKLNSKIVTWHLPAAVEAWLGTHGVTATPIEAAPREQRHLILVGDVSSQHSTAEEWSQLARRMATGSTVIFLAPQAFQRGEQEAGWLPLARKGQVRKFVDWLYHKECVAKPHPVFAGLQAKGLMDWDYYGPVIPHLIFDGQDTPADVVAAAFAAGYWPGNYVSGVLLGSYKFGGGQFFLNSLVIIENVDRHPAADRLLLNLIEYGAASVSGPALPLPEDFDLQLKQIGYTN